jgi:hypothetical protein
MIQPTDNRHAPPRFSDPWLDLIPDFGGPLLSDEDGDFWCDTVEFDPDEPNAHDDDPLPDRVIAIGQKVLEGHGDAELALWEYGEAVAKVEPFWTGDSVTRPKLLRHHVYQMAYCHGTVEYEGPPDEKPMSPDDARHHFRPMLDDGLEAEQELLLWLRRSRFLVNRLGHCREAPVQMYDDLLARLAVAAARIRGCAHDLLNPERSRPYGGDVVEVVPPAVGSAEEVEVDGRPGWERLCSLPLELQPISRPDIGDDMTSYGRTY